MVGCEVSCLLLKTLLIGRRRSSIIQPLRDEYCNFGRILRVLGLLLVSATFVSSKFPQIHTTGLHLLLTGSAHVKHGFQEHHIVFDCSTCSLTEPSVLIMCE